MTVRLIAWALLLASLDASAQLQPLDVSEAPSTLAAGEIRRSLQLWFGQPNVCPGEPKAPTTVRDALGPLARRVVVHRYESRAWPTMAVVSDYVGRVLAGVPETGGLSPFPLFSELVVPEIAGVVEFRDGSVRPIEFANGYVHATGDNGCEWWGRYLGGDKSRWIVRR